MNTIKAGKSFELFTGDFLMDSIIFLNKEPSPLGVHVSLKKRFSGPNSHYGCGCLKAVLRKEDQPRDVIKTLC